jgi:hypothetical protein
MLAERRPHEIMILAIHLCAHRLSLKHDVATNLQQKISEEEYCSRISINRRRNSEVGTVKERYKAEQDHEWYAAPTTLMPHPRARSFPLPSVVRRIGQSHSLVFSLH